MANEFSTALSDLGGAVSDLFGAKGATASAGSFSQAASIAEQNAALTGQATRIRETQEARQIYRTIGGQKASVGGAGFAESGSALDLLRSSVSEGALTKAITEEQGAITENSYAEQAGQFRGMASAARSSATGQTIGGLIQGAGGLLNAVSGISKAFGGSQAAAPVFDATVTSVDAAAAFDVGATAADTTGLASLGSSVLGADAAFATGSELAVAAAGTDVFAELAVAAAWIVCTELHRQGRLPTRWYVPGARRFARYGETEKRGYYLWAIPATQHLRAHPDSRFSGFLEWLFNHRAEYIAAQAGVRGARKTVQGWLTLAGVYAVCWVLGKTVARRTTDLSVLDRA